MKRVIIIAVIASVLALQNSFDTKSLLAQVKKESAASTLPSVTNSSHTVAGPAAQAQQPSTILNPVAPLVSTVIPSADTSSPILKEILSANNEVVSRVATMYQHFGLFITIMVTLVGVFVGVLGFLARRTVHGFIQEWTKKLESHEKEVKDALHRLHEAVNEAEASATAAAKDRQSIEDSKKVFTEAIHEADRLRTIVAREEGATVEPPPPTATGGEAYPAPEPSNTAEDEEVAAHLEGKINPR